MNDDGLKRLFDSMRQENAAAPSETHPYFEVLTEGTRKDTRLVAESAVHMGDKVDRTATSLHERSNARLPRR